MFRSIVQMIVSLTTACSNACVAINSLAVAAAERTSIVEEKSVRAAALSALRGETDFIIEYSEMEAQISKDVKVASRKSAETYLEKFRANRAVHTI
jgi:hypothetical protein